MAHQYSVEIHEFLGEKLKEIHSALEEARSKGEETAIRYQEGRLELLNQMRKHMTDKFDLANQKYY